MNNRIKSTSLRLNITNWSYYQHHSCFYYNSDWVRLTFISKYMNSLFNLNTYCSKHSYVNNLFKTLKYKKRLKKMISSQIHLKNKNALFQYKKLRKRILYSNIINRIKQLSVYIGTCRIKKNINGLYIYINYYYDHLNNDLLSFKNNSNYLLEHKIDKTFQYAITFLSKIFNYKVFLIKNNIYDKILRNFMLFKKVKSAKHNIQASGKNIQKIITREKYRVFHLMRIFFYKASLKQHPKMFKKRHYLKKIYQKRKFFVNNLMKYSSTFTQKFQYIKNDILHSNMHLALNAQVEYSIFFKKMFFLSRNKNLSRLNQLLFSAFFLKKIDLKLVSNAISIEFSTLRKGHKRFFKTICQLFSHFFKNLQTKFKLKGLTLIIKGRLILKNRQTPRKKKFVLNLGQFKQSTLISTILEENSLAFSRLGVINVKLTATYFKQKTISYINALNSIENTNYSKNINNNLNNVIAPNIDNFFSLKNCFLSLNTTTSCILLNNIVIKRYLNYRAYIQKILYQKHTFAENLVINYKIDLDNNIQKITKKNQIYLKNKKINLLNLFLFLTFLDKKQLN